MAFLYMAAQSELAATVRRAALPLLEGRAAARVCALCRRSAPATPEPTPCPHPFTRNKAMVLGSSMLIHNAKRYLKTPL